MNSLTFRERFKGKLGVIMKNGTFNIKESSAVVKRELPQEKFHPVHKSQSLNFKGIEKVREYCDSRKLTEASSQKNQSYFIYPQSQKSKTIRKVTETTFESILSNRKFSESTLTNNKEKERNMLPTLKPKFQIASIAKISLEPCFKYSTSMQKHK